LSVNPNKTTAILFTNNRNPYGFFKPRLFVIELELKHQVKYLGLILDSKQNWNAHIDYRLRKASVALWQFRCAIGKTLGLPKVVYWLYTSVVRPILTYATVLWWKKTTQSNVNIKISHLQRLACLCVTGSMRSTPTFLRQRYQIC
jgi:hypothetical protein